MPGIEVMTHEQCAIDAGRVQRLYTAEGWWPERSTVDIDRILRSGPAVGAWAGLLLVGFVRAVTDGVARAYVEDMVVDPGWRGEDIGVRLLDRAAPGACRGTCGELVLRCRTRRVLRSRRLSVHGAASGSPPVVSVQAGIPDSVGYWFKAAPFYVVVEGSSL